jgi:dTDP-4-dehydrorhamnose reductase
MKGEPYTEEDKPNPINVYGKTKLAGELAVQESGCMHITLRTSWVYGARGKNFFLTMLRLAREKEEIRVVDDQIGCPTWCKQIATVTGRIIKDLMDPDTGKIRIESERAGIYHYSASGYASWYQFAELIFKNDPKKEEHKLNRLIPIHTSAYPTPARRPLYSVISKEKIQGEFGLQPMTWQEHLQGCWEHRASPG